MLVPFPPRAPTGPTGAFTGLTRQDRGTMYYLQSGIRKRLNALGYSTVYGEHQNFEDFSEHRNITLGAVASEVVNSEAVIWGFGFVQDIDKASLQLFSGFRHRSADIDVIQAVNGPEFSVPLEDFWTLPVGGKLRF